MPVYWVLTPLYLVKAQTSQEEFICVLLKFPVFYSICWYEISVYIYLVAVYVYAINTV